MGTDNLFKKKQTTNSKRKKGRRPLAERILIVCEGEKSEPQYLGAFCKHFRIHTAEIVKIDIFPSKGSDPKSVAESAVKQKRKADRDNPYDLIYCVMDGDRPEKLPEAQKIAKEHGLDLILSKPCFEYWLLLHFVNTTRGFGQGGRCPCDELISDLKKHVPNYEKSGMEYRVFLCKTDTALGNAKRLKNGAPSHTNMHELIERLKRYARD